MWSKLRNYFLTGIIITAPIAVTLYVTWGLVNFVDQQTAWILPHDAWTIYGVRIPGVGLVVAFVLLVFVGWLAAGVIGRYFLRVGERLIGATPIVRSLYSATKQIFTTILGSSSTTFRKVVVVEFPRKGCYALGFLTNEKSDVDHLVGRKMSTVFLPTAPNPTSGYLLFFDKKDVIVADMSVEEGLKLVVSGGIVTKKDAKAAKRRTSAKPRRRPTTRS